MLKVYFDKEGLMESSEMYDRMDLSYFLFSSISGVYPFVKYEEELAEINDYCYFILCQIEEKLKELIQEAKAPYELVKGYQRQQEYTDEEIDMIFDPSYSFSPLLTWEKLSRDINKCTLLLLLLSYLESSLNEIAKWFCEEKSITLGRKGKESNEIKFYLDKIGQCCHCDLVKTLENELAYLDTVRKIRNQFVHREWDQVEKHYDKFYLCDVFHVISQCFSEIEKAACREGIIEVFSVMKS